MMAVAEAESSGKDDADKAYLKEISAGSLSWEGAVTKEIDVSHVSINSEHECRAVVPSGFQS